MRYLTTIVAVLALSVLPLARQASGKSIISKCIDALTTAPSLVVYSADGAADATVTENPPPQVKAIVNLGPKAIPLLIAHLNDTRPTAARFQYYIGRKEQDIPVPVGHVCLDILTYIIKAPKVLREDCADDGLGACVERGYYFPPDAYIRKNGKFIARAEVYRVKRNWQRAYRKGYIKYQYPKWWKRRS